MIAPPYTAEFVHLFLPLIENDGITGTLRTDDGNDPVSEFICELSKQLLDFSLTVKAATLIFISGCGSAISSAKEGKSSFIYNLEKS